MTEAKDDKAERYKGQFKALYDLSKRGENVSTDTIKELYDSWTDDYEKDLRSIKYAGPSVLSSIFTKHCSQKNASILDIGAGTGLVGEELHKLGFTNIVGLDISQKSLDVAEQKGVYKTLVCSDMGAERQPFDENTFDAVVCCGCLLPTHLRPSCIREWVSLVKPGGIIAMAMRQRYLEVEKGDEEYFSQQFKTEFDEVTQELETAGKWKMISRTNIPKYIEEAPGMALVSKVL